MTEPDAPDRWRETVVEALRREDVAITGEVTLSRLGSSRSTSTWSLACRTAKLFVKRAEEDHGFMLDAEADALDALARAGAIRVPRVIARGRAGATEFLALEWLDLAPGRRGAALGHALARLHATTSPRFGWHRDNAVGPTPQVNAWSEDWPTFFRERRIRPQLELAASNGWHGELQRDGAALLGRIDELLAGHRPAASLLHGDLWSGNAGELGDGTPVVFDPAPSYGDREADLAMTALFGGFEPAFHAAYASAMPLPQGHATRRPLYNLYHVLNHLNLFGGAYLAQAERMIVRLLALR